MDQESGSVEARLLGLFPEVAACRGRLVDELDRRIRCEPPDSWPETCAKADPPGPRRPAMREVPEPVHADA